MSDQHFKIRDKRGTNRYFVDNKFLKEYGAKLGPYSIAVYNVLVMRADFDTQAYKTSYQTIADLTGMSRRQAMREVEKLVSHNIIAKEVKWHPSETGKKVYTDPEFTLLHPDQWGNTDSIMDTRTSDTQSLPIDSQSPEVMTPSHQTSDTQSPPPSDSESLINKQEPTTQEPLQKDKADKPPPKMPDTIPSFQVYVEETGYYSLNKPQRRIIDKEVGSDPASLDKWREVVRTWILCGYKPINAKGMLDWFRDGIPDKVKGQRSNGQRRGEKVVEPTSETVERGEWLTEQFKKRARRPAET